MTSRSALLVLCRRQASTKQAAPLRLAQKFLEDGNPGRFFLECPRRDDSENQWIWGKLRWEYKDGRQVRYPDHKEIS